jgi:hypothetical protein
MKPNSNKTYIELIDTLNTMLLVKTKRLLEKETIDSTNSEKAYSIVKVIEDIYPDIKIEHSDLNMIILIKHKDEFLGSLLLDQKREKLIIEKGYRYNKKTRSGKKIIAFINITLESLMLQLADEYLGDTKERIEKVIISLM